MKEIAKRDHRIAVETVGVSAAQIEFKIFIYAKRKSHFEISRGARYKKCSEECFSGSFTSCKAEKADRRLKCKVTYDLGCDFNRKERSNIFGEAR